MRSLILLTFILSLSAAAQAQTRVKENIKQKSLPEDSVKGTKTVLKPKAVKVRK